MATRRLLLLRASPTVVRECPAVCSSGCTSSVGGGRCWFYGLSINAASGIAPAAAEAGRGSVGLVVAEVQAAAAVTWCVVRSFSSGAERDAGIGGVGGGSGAAVLSRSAAPKLSSEYPDRPPPPEARPIIEPGQLPPPQDVCGVGEDVDGARLPTGQYATLMQQIAGAVQPRAADFPDCGRRSKLEEVLAKMREEEELRAAAGGTVTVKQLHELLSRFTAAAKAISVRKSDGDVASLLQSEVDRLAEAYGVDAALLTRVVRHVRVREADQLRDGGILLGI